MFDPESLASLFDGCELSEEMQACIDLIPGGEAEEGRGMFFGGGGLFSPMSRPSPSVGSMIFGGSGCEQVETGLEDLLMCIWEAKNEVSFFLKNKCAFALKISFGQFGAYGNPKPLLANELLKP